MGCRRNGSIKALVKTLSFTTPQAASPPAQFAMVALRRPRGAILALPCSLGFRLAFSATGGARLRPPYTGAPFGKNSLSAALYTREPFGNVFPIKKAIPQFPISALRQPRAPAGQSLFSHAEAGEDPLYNGFLNSPARNAPQGIQGAAQVRSQTIRVRALGVGSQEGR